ICFVVQGYYGLGRHTKTISKEDLVTFEKISFIQAIVSAIGALGMVKISIALFLLRLSKSKWYSCSLWTLIGFVVTYTVCAWLTFFLRCRPVASFWDHSLGGICYSMQLFKSVSMTNTADMAVFTDVCFSSLPIPIIWGLQMSRRTKGYLILVLSLGYFSVAMGIIKAKYQLSLVTNLDKHFDMSIQFWGTMQLNMGIIAANIPTLKPLLQKIIRTTSGDGYQQHNVAVRLGNGTIGSGNKLCRPRIGYRNSVYVRTEGGRFETIRNSRMHGQLKALDRGLKADMYSVDEDRVGSEERILDGVFDDPKSIKCTTELVVNTVKKENVT
ncbi:hypothetical protein FB567DRAFT_604586, partial [Paraphoma chrysanthemicola]